MTIPLTIVTSCAGYGQYLPEWAASILGQQTRPAAVAVFTHGVDAADGAAAVAALRAGGIVARHEHHPERLDFGEARNRAVAMSATEWVMHLDADDTLMPHALADVAPLMPKADVVALGYERSGDLSAGPKMRRKTYRTLTGPEVVSNPTPASGVSPFRRRFWEQTPYRTDLIGGWDTALWIGFGHLGARIVPTSRPCFWYRQHRDSTFNTRRKQGWATEWTGQKFESLRRQDRGVAFLVPRMLDFGPRDRLWGWLRRRWEAQFPDWSIHEGMLSGAVWTKGDALRNALERCRAEIVIVADADCVHPPEALEEAVARVRAGAPWVVPHGNVHRLSEQQTAAVLSGSPSAHVAAPTTGLARAVYPGYPGGGCLVVPRVTLAACKGIPAQFTGWGCEDETLALILDTLAGPHERLAAPLVHLWHPPQSGRSGPDYRRNRALMARYAAAAGNPEAMWALVLNGATGGHDPYSNPTWRLRTTYERGRAMRDDYQHSRGDVFRLRQLEAQHLRMTKEREEAIAARRAKVEAYKAGQAERILKRKMLRPGAPAQAVPVEDKMMPDLPPVEQDAEGEALVAVATEALGVADAEAAVDTTGEIRFATVKAREAAEEAGLTPEELAAIPAGPRGITIAQIREARRDPHL